MTLDQLRIFVEVAERQHLTQAAAVLFLTPSAVSTSIKSLEERYGTALFHRVGRRIEISDAGRIFLVEARRALASAQAAEAVLQGGADLGFVEGNIEPTGLEEETVGEDNMVVVVASDHPWADGRTLTARELEAGQWILREAGSGTRSALETGLAALDVAVVNLQIALELPSNEAVRSAVMAGPFATAMSELVVAPHVQAGLLARAHCALPARSFSMLRHAQRHRSRAVAAFEDMVRTRKRPDN